MANLPAIDAPLRECPHEGGPAFRGDTHEQTPTRLSSITLKEFEVLHLIFDFHEPLVDWQLVDHELKRLLLRLS